MNVKKETGTLLILLAGILWGTMGIFVRGLAQYQFTPVQIVCLRLTVAVPFFWLVLLWKSPAHVTFRPTDFILFPALGFGSILLFTWCYFTAIQIMPMSTAAILLYTSPIWVMILSLICFHEPINSKKILALVFSFLGCILVSGLSGGGLSLRGLILGLAAGMGYGLYSILGSIALKRFSPFTITAYTFTLAALGTWLASNPIDLCHKLVHQFSPALLALAVSCGLITAVIPFLAYTMGLVRVSPSKAAILATVEPLVATLLGTLVYKEPLSITAALGILCIFTAIVLLQLPGSSKKDS